MNRFFQFLIIIAIAGFVACSPKEELNIDLSGEWQFKMDPNDIGEQEKWFDSELPETINLPGSMVENGKGYNITVETEWTGFVADTNWVNNPNFAPYHDPENIRYPFWLQPLKKYTGAAWYIKKVTIPASWKEKAVKLYLERPHWETKVWINGINAGMQNSLAVAHIYDVSEYLQPGENSIAVCVDNRLDEINPGPNAHSITDHTQSNWHGIVGKMELVASDAIYIDNVKIFPDVKNKKVDIEAIVKNITTEKTEIEIEVNARHKQKETHLEKSFFKFTVTPGENVAKMTYELGENAELWNEFHPNVYELSLEMSYKKGMDNTQVDFGLREFKVSNGQLTNNGQKVFLRGTLDCAVFPLTGYPPTDKAGWRKVFEAAKSHGLNHIRFHSWCPPKAAFEVADEMGFYIQAECSAWCTTWTRSKAPLGNGDPIDQYVWDESFRIVKEYGNHPSFVLMAHGNEPSGPKHEEFLTDFVNYWKKTDDRRIYTAGAGWPMLPVNDFHNIAKPRIQSGVPPIKNVLNAEHPKTNFDWTHRMPEDGIPVVSHEIGQYCVYPNFNEIKKYTGVLKPKNFEIFKESLEANNMGHLADSFFMASGKLQALCYKAEIESAMRTPEMGGFQLLDLSDFSGQGTALVGVLDAFYDEKGYISPEEFRRFCSTTVPLARMSKRIFTEGETLTAEIEVSHFGEKQFRNVNPKWKIKNGNEIVAEGTLGEQDIHFGNCIQLGQVEYQFQRENRPRKLVFEVAVEHFSNSWDIWVYPENNELKTDEVRIVENLDNGTINYLENGGEVLLSLGKGKVSPEMGGDIGVGFSSIFWNSAWFPDQKLRTLGILCNPKHPAFEWFPTEYHSNYQWWDATYHGSAIQLDRLPKDLSPIVRIIDDWFTNRPLALIFEAKVGKGKILISGVDLINNMESRVEARQLKFSLLKYMESENFNPQVAIKTKQIKSILK